MKLTPQEIRIVAFLLLALIVGGAVKHWRQKHAQPIPIEATGSSQAE